MILVVGKRMPSNGAYILSKKCAFFEAALLLYSGKGSSFRECKAVLTISVKVHNAEMEVQYPLSGEHAY